jgi:ankyrin
VLLVATLLGGAHCAAAHADTRLADAAMTGDAAAVRSLLAEGTQIDSPGGDGTRALHWAVRRDDLPTATLLLRAGADAVAANHYGVTPLYLAASNGNAAMIEQLLDAGADPSSADPTGETALMTAVRSGSDEAVRALLDRGADVDGRDLQFRQTPLMFAIRENRPSIAKLLIESGADVNARTRIGAAPEPRLPGAGGGSHGVGIVRGGWPERGMRAPIPGGMSPLLYAARDGRLEATEMLVAASADANQADANGIAPLLMAITNNQIPAARVLLNHGAQINVADWYGRTPLWAAVDTRNLDVDSSTLENGVDRTAVLELVELLLERGADPNARIAEVPPIRRWMMPLGSLSWVDFTGETPFVRAALAGDTTVMRRLLEHRADPSIPTFGGTSALMAAAGVNWVFNQTYDEGPGALMAAVKLCLELGADVNAVNSMGLSAVHGAANRGSDDIITFLVERGAKVDVADKEGRAPLTWAQGVFLATHAPEPKPSTIELIRKLSGE